MDFSDDHLISTTQAQNNFGSCLKKLQTSAEPLFVEKHGKPVAVMMSYREWQILMGGADHKENRLVTACKKLVNRMAKKGVKQTNAVELIRKLRDERS